MSIFEAPDLLDHIQRCLVYTKEKKLTENQRMVIAGVLAIVLDSQYKRGHADGRKHMMQNILSRPLERVDYGFVIPDVANCKPRAASSVQKQQRKAGTHKARRK